MLRYQEIEGNLINLAKEGKFDVISHGCNCFNMQQAGIADAMRIHFNTDKFDMEGKQYYGDINKLGQIDYEVIDRRNGSIVENFSSLLDNDELLDYVFSVVNSYTQYHGGKNLDYAALDLCLKKINHKFKGQKIGLPMIGCGIAGGEWLVVKRLIQKNLKDMDVTIVIFKK